MWCVHMCACVCMSVCVYVCRGVCACVCMLVFAHLCTCVCMWQENKEGIVCGRNETSRLECRYDVYENGPIGHWSITTTPVFPSFLHPSCYLIPFPCCKDHPQDQLVGPHLESRHALGKFKLRHRLTLRDIC